jgi:hypothetical protein
MEELKSPKESQREYNRSLSAQAEVIKEQIGWQDPPDAGEITGRSILESLKEIESGPHNPA